MSRSAQDRAGWLPRSSAARPFYAGVDLGGTNIKAGLVDDLGRTLAFHTEPTHVTRGPEDAAIRMGRAVHTLAREAGIEMNDVACVGLGSPGPLDIPAGRIVKAGNLRGWDDFALRDRVSAHCGRPVAFANDANAAAYGEFWIGSGRDAPSLVLLTLGTGVGGGIIIGDTNVEGAHSHGSECGHMIVDASDTARMCPCGQRGHLEAYASATSLVKRARERLAEGASGSLAHAVAEGADLTPILLGTHVTGPASAIAHRHTGDAELQGAKLRGTHCFCTLAALPSRNALTRSLASGADWAMEDIRASVKKP